ncbi:MAG: secretin N-terminal domain-containing protein, partial [Planctomycetota bacterium]
SESMKYKIFPLKYISVEQGKRYLTDVGIGTVSAFPGSSALLVTANPDELIRAMAILNLVDSQGRFEVSRALGASVGKNFPSNEQIASRLGNIAIGNFSNPPAVSAKYRAMIDVHKDAVIVIAPVRKLETILSAVRELSNHENLFTQGNTGAGGNWTGPELPRPDMSGLPFAGQGSVMDQPSTVPTMFEKAVAELPAPAKPYESESISNGEDTLQLALPERLSLVDFLGFVGEHLNLNYLYDETKVKGDITFKVHGKDRGPIKLKELYPLLEQVMQLHGFVMTRRGNVVTVVPTAEAQSIDPELYPDSKEIAVGDAVITRVFKLIHIDTTNAKNLLESMKLTVDVKEVAATKTLIVTGFSYRMPRIEALLDLVDKPGEPKKFRFRQLQYTMAETLSPKIQALAEHLGTITITIAEGPKVAPRPSPRKPGETTAAYTARIRRESSQAAARRTTTAAKAEQDQAGVYLDADERTNRILMIGTQEQLDEVEELIDTLDVAQQNLRTFKLYKMKHVDAEEARRKLEELRIITPVQRSAYPYSSSRITGGAQQTAASTTRTPTTTTRPPTTRQRLDSDLQESIAGEPQVVVVEQTNSLLVNATAEQHTQVSKIIAYIDSEMEEEEIPYKIYPLENQSPDHLFSILEPLVQETVLDKEGKIESVIRKQEEQITIVPDPNTFSLVVYASKKNQVWIGDLITKLDQRRPQVLIDVTLVQISKTDAFNYDLNIIQSFPDLVATSGLTSAIMPGVAEGSSLVSKLLESGRDRFVDFQSNSGKGTGFYGDKHINALITAMEEKDYGRVLAKPKILVNDNEPGVISATDTTYVTKTTGAVVEGSTGVVQTGVDYQGYDAGITLDIVPHISRGELLRLDITLTRSDFGTITGERPPDTNSNEINTTVTVPDGSTIILGGLLKLNQSKGGTKVPILGDIPLIGGLFRSTSNSDLQRHMYVFVKAEIIRPDEQEFVRGDLQRISDRNRESFEEREIEFQDYRNWPGVKPRKMTPLKVLEVQ